MLNSMFLRGLLAATLLASVAACSSDGRDGSTAGSGSSQSTLTKRANGDPTIPQMGLTGTGGTTDALGVASLVDPILGSDGTLGGGDDGQVGSALPADQLSQLSSQTAPVAGQIANALPLDMVTSQIPGLGVAGQGGLVDDIVHQDPVSDILGTNGAVGALVGGGNNGALGDVVPAGSVPALPAQVAGNPLDTAESLPSSGQLQTVTGALTQSGANPADILPTLGALSGGTSGSTAPTDIVGNITKIANPAVVTGLVSQVTSTVNQ
jgi:hypothetical protein